MEDAREITLKTLFADLLDFVFPPQCQVCGNGFISSDGNIWLCEKCRASLSELPAPICPICRSFLNDISKRCSNCRRKSSVEWVYSLGTYDDKFSRLIKCVKYTPRPDLAKYLAHLLADKLKVMQILSHVDAVTYVPMYHKKEAARGFNQAAILAKELGRLLEIPFLAEQVTQTKAVSDQIGLTAEERFRNVSGIYKISRHFELNGKNVLLVDDVTTSGATLNSVAAAMREGGAKSVVAVTVAVALEEGIDPTTMYEQLAEEEF